MSPFRWDVLLVGFVLAVPVLALGLRGDLSDRGDECPPALVSGRRLGRGRAAAVRQRAATPARRPTTGAAAAPTSRRAARTPSPRRPLTRRARRPLASGCCAAPRGSAELQRAWHDPGRRCVHRPSTAVHGSRRGRRPTGPPQRRRMADADMLRTPLLLRRDARSRQGWSDDELGRLVRAGELDRLRRGAYVDARSRRMRSARHRLLVRATMAGLRRPAVVSHQSAAVLHGLPLWGGAARPGAHHPPTAGVERQRAGPALPCGEAPGRRGDRGRRGAR